MLLFNRNATRSVVQLCNVRFCVAALGLLCLFSCRSRDDLHVRAVAGYFAQYNELLRDDLNMLRIEFENARFDPKMLATTRPIDSAYDALELLFIKTNKELHEAVSAAEQWTQNFADRPDYLLQRAWKTLYASLSRYYSFLDCPIIAVLSQVTQGEKRLPVTCRK